MTLRKGMGGSTEFLVGEDMPQFDGDNARASNRLAVVVVEADVTRARPSLLLVRRPFPPLCENGTPHSSSPCFHNFWNHVPANPGTVPVDPQPAQPALLIEH